MTLEQHRYKVGKFIIIAHLSLFFFIFGLYVIDGFTIEEMGIIFRFLIPIKTIYITTLVKYVIANKKKVKEGYKKLEDVNIIDPLYKTVTNFFIYSHITLLALSFLACAFNVISFVFFENTITIIETFFGAYIGLIIFDLFNIQENEKK